MKKSVKVTIKSNISPNMLRMASLLKVIILNYGKKHERLIDFIPKQTEKLVILGNGPSLLKSLQEDISQIVACDAMCVNQFAESEYYEIVRPRYYVLADSNYWNPTFDGAEKWLRALISAIKTKTTWEMTLFLSEKAKESTIVKELREKQNIQVVYYSALGIDQDSLNKEKYFELLKKDMVTPPAQTVLNTCITIAVYYSFKEVFIIGADTSWHEQYYVDQETNDLYTDDRHFYGTERILEYRYSEERSNLGISFQELAKVLFLYQDLKEYGEKYGTKIYNASKFSWIDVFERKKISN